MQDKTITIKNSPARNLHRLLNTLAFISSIFKGLKAGKSLKDAVTGAYDDTLGKLHAWVVRTGIKAGMLGLPSREAFFKSIGETGEFVCFDVCLNMKWMTNINAIDMQKNQR